MITLSPVSIVVGIAALIVGFVEVVVADRVIYPSVRRRHEMKKVTGRHGIDPRSVMNVVRFQGLVILPVLGVLFGETLFGDAVRRMVE
jgi:hypothetical protein